MLWLLLGSALAVDASTLWKGLEDPAGWVEVHRESFKDVGVEVIVRLKRVEQQPCLEATTAAAIPADVLLHLASDIPTQPSWSTWKIPVSERLGSSGNGFDYMQVLDNPYPVADRVWVLHGTPMVVGSARVFRWDRLDGGAAYPDALARVKQSRPDVVETTVNLGDWTFTPQGETTTIRYRICSDAGGDIPEKAKEFAAKKTLPTNLADIVRKGLSVVGK